MVPAAALFLLVMGSPNQQQVLISQIGRTTIARALPSLVKIPLTSAMRSAPAIPLGNIEADSPNGTYTFSTGLTKFFQNRGGGTVGDLNDIKRYLETSNFHGASVKFQGWQDDSTFNVGITDGNSHATWASLGTFKVGKMKPLNFCGWLAPNGLLGVVMQHRGFFEISSGFSEILRTQHLYVSKVPKELETYTFQRTGASPITINGKVGNFQVPTEGNWDLIFSSDSLYAILNQEYLVNLPNSKAIRLTGDHHYFISIPTSSISSGAKTLHLTISDAKRMGVFLSNFAEVELPYFSATKPLSQDALLEFALKHFAWNRGARYLTREKAREIVNRYFELELIIWKSMGYRKLANGRFDYGVEHGEGDQPDQATVRSVMQKKDGLLDVICSITNEFSDPQLRGFRRAIIRKEGKSYILVGWERAQP